MREWTGERRRTAKVTKKKIKTDDKKIIDGTDDDDGRRHFSYSEKEIKKDGSSCERAMSSISSSQAFWLPPGTEASKYGKPYTGKLPWCLISFRTMDNDCKQVSETEERTEWRWK